MSEKCELSQEFDEARILRLEPGDVLALKVDRPITGEKHRRIEELAVRAIGRDDVRVLVLSEGIEPVVLRQDCGPRILPEVDNDSLWTKEARG
jgi:hypothetical protein